MVSRSRALKSVLSLRGEWVLPSAIELVKEYHHRGMKDWKIMYWEFQHRREDWLRKLNNGQIEFTNHDYQLIPIRVRHIRSMMDAMGIMGSELHRAEDGQKEDRFIAAHEVFKTLLQDWEQLEQDATKRKEAAE